MRIEHAAVPSPFVPIDFAAKEREARQRFQQYRGRARRVAGAPARRKDSAWAANAARRLRLAAAESF